MAVSTRRWRQWGFGGALLWLLTACSAQSASPQATHGTVAAALYQAAVSSEGEQGEAVNHLFSPISLQRLLAMITAGSAGQSRDLLLDRFGDSLLKPAHSRQLQLSEAAFVQQGKALLPEYVKQLQRDYDAEIITVDFSHATAAATSVNNWVDKRTGGELRELLKPEAVKAETRLLLVATALLQQQWQVPFMVNLNQRGRFSNADASQQEVTFMRNTAQFGYLKTEQYQLLQLGFADSTVKLLLMLPAPGESLTATTAALLANPPMAELPLRWVLLHLPRLEIKQHFPLNGALQAVGVGALFTNQANFSRITGDESLYISDTVHQVRLRFDEQGVSAAAVAAAIFAPKSVPKLPYHELELHFNRPFAFVMIDTQSREPLFAGSIGKL
ncbi:MAG: serpin family protein [Gammaproteobacteria bacterium]|nr:serpin family protein [Gammaproteobacteria bacterium]